MKKLFLVVLYAGLVASKIWAASAQNLIAQIHFIGAEQIAADTNSIAFTNLWLTPEARALRAQTLGKLSRAPYAWLKANIPAGAGNRAELLRPLLDDLLTSEWFFKASSAPGRLPEFALAIHLSASRAELWQSNLATVLEAWTKLPAEKFQKSGKSGWLLKKHLPPNLIRFVRVGDWAVFSCEQDKFPMADALVEQVRVTNRPAPIAKDYWLSADVDWPGLAQWFPALKFFDLPRTKMQVIGRNPDLRVDGKFLFTENLSLKIG